MFHRPCTQKKGRQIQTVSAFPLWFPGRSAAVLFSVIGSIHTAHIRCRRCCRRSRLLDVGNQRFGRQDRGRNGGSVLQRGARDLRRVDDAFFEHIAVGVGQRVVAVADGCLRLEVLDDDGALDAGVRRDLADRLLERLQNDRRTGLLVALNGLDIRLDSRDRVDERGAAACNDAFLDSRLRRFRLSSLLPAFRS